MRRIRNLTVSKEIHAAMAEHLGADFRREKRAARRSNVVRYVVVPLALAVLAAVLFALFHQ